MECCTDGCSAPGLESHKVLPVFIGGFRSGTTLLVNLLGLHESLSPWFETKAFCEALRLLRVLRLPDSRMVEAGLVRPASIKGFSVDAVAQRMLSDFGETSARQRGVQHSGKAPGERYPLGNDVINYSLADAKAAVECWRNELNDNLDLVTSIRATGQLIRHLGRHQQAFDGKQMWINKTPEITRFMPELRLCLGGCRFIMMIRDGRRVVRSAARLGWAEAAEIAVWWRAMIDEARHGAAADPDRYLEVRYEDLVSQPADELDSILRFLHVKPQGASLVESYLNALNIDSLTQGSSTRALTETITGTIEPDVESLVDAKFNASLGY